MALEFRGNNNKCGPRSLPRPPYPLSSAQVGTEGVGTVAVGSAGWVSKQDTWAPWECLAEGGKITPDPTRPDPTRRGSPSEEEDIGIPRQLQPHHMYSSLRCGLRTKLHARISVLELGLSRYHMHRWRPPLRYVRVRRTANLSDPNNERNPFRAPLSFFPSFLPSPFPS